VLIIESLHALPLYPGSVVEDEIKGELTNCRMLERNRKGEDGIKKGWGEMKRRKGSKGRMEKEEKKEGRKRELKEKE
jgi:hypothetical protein